MQRTKIAVTGNYPFTMQAAPFDDEEWKITGIGTNGFALARWDELYELHDMEEMERVYGDEETWMSGWKYVQSLPANDRPVYMFTRHPKVPASVEYPLRPILKEFGAHLWWAGRKLDGQDRPPNKNRPYPMMASACYQMAKAISDLTPLVRDGKECWLGLWGIDMSENTEYAYQRPSVWSLMGFAMGRGINVVVPELSELFKSRCLYGYHEDSAGGGFNGRLSMLRRELTERLASEKDEMKRERLMGGLNMTLFMEREFV